MELSKILSYCDHTLLSQTATFDEIKVIIDDAIKYGCASVCIPPALVKRASEYAGGRMKICTVIGFPNGYSTEAVKVFETREAVREGADEIDMVINVGLLKEGGFVIADKDGCLHLTEEGLDVAKRTYECHTVLTDFFKKLGIPDEVAVEDACRIEHCISKETLSAIKRLNETL